jgi:hypothetical protein
LINIVAHARIPLKAGRQSEVLRIKRGESNQPDTMTEEAIKDSRIKMGGIYTTESAAGLAYLQALNDSILAAKSCRNTGNLHPDGQCICWRRFYCRKKGILQ